MATMEIRLPQWGMGMIEGSITQWYKSVGDEVAEGEPLAEVEAAKTTEELVAPVAGVLLSVLVEAGRVVPVHELLATIGEPGTIVTTAPVGVAEAEPTVCRPLAAPFSDAESAANSGGVRAVPLARRRARELGVDLSDVRSTGPHGRVLVADVEAAHQVGASKQGGVRNVAPKARFLARQHGLDLAVVEGTGPGGRISVKDVESAVQQLADAAAAVPVFDRGLGVGSDDRTETSPRTPQIDLPATRAAELHTGAGGAPLSPMRRTIARRMTESLQATAQLTLFRTIDITAVVGFRESLAATQVPSFTDIFIRVCALALGAHPGVNAWLEGDRLVIRDSIDIGFAVAVDDGLFVPVVHHADQLTLPEISARTRTLVRKCREHDIAPSDLGGGGFSITSLGGQGIDAFTPILNPPEAAILGIGRTSEHPVRYGDGFGWRTELTASLTIDHRIVDGAPGAAFLETVAGILSDPRKVFC